MGEHEERVLHLLLFRAKALEQELDASILERVKRFFTGDDMHFHAVLQHLQATFPGIDVQTMPGARRPSWLVAYGGRETVLYLNDLNEWRVKDRATNRGPLLPISSYKELDAYLASG